jgi:hypothetical protein
MLTLLSKGVPPKSLKFFWLKIFFICHRCQQHRWSTLSCEYLRKFREKNKKSKISWHCPFKVMKPDFKYNKKCCLLYSYSSSVMWQTIIGIARGAENRGQFCFQWPTILGSFRQPTFTSVQILYKKRGGVPKPATLDSSCPAVTPVPTCISYSW